MLHATARSAVALESATVPRLQHAVADGLRTGTRGWREVDSSEAAGRIHLPAVCIRLGGGHRWRPDQEVQTAVRPSGRDGSHLEQTLAQGATHARCDRAQLSRWAVSRHAVGTARERGCPGVAAFAVATVTGARRRVEAHVPHSIRKSR